MKTQTAPLALRDFAESIGREEPLYVVHGGVLRAAHAIRPVVESGAMLAACSDEFNGEIRAAFDRDVARMLTAPNVPGTRRVFSVSNMGGRVEPGAITLANVHFTALSREAGEKLLLIEIASHVGRRDEKGGDVWGELDRFGAPSPCCGALRMLLDVPAGSGAVRFPWFDQLNAFFGAERLAALRADSSPHRMLRAAIVHAVLQAESAIVDLLREPPATPTQVILVPIVAVNRRGPDNAIPVGLFHLRFEAGMTQIVFGSSLRSTPSSLIIDASQSNLRVSSPFADPVHVPPLIPPRIPPVISPRVRAEAKTPEVRAQIENARRQLRALHTDPATLRVYARPLLRAFMQGLSIVAPEAALATFALEGASDLLHVEHVKKLLDRGPSAEEARKVLHDLEPSLQQLGHREARGVLETLLDTEHPLFGDSAV